MKTTLNALLALLLLLPLAANAQAPDADGDGVPDTVDACPTDDGSFFDGDGDGCTDPLAHARHIEYWDVDDLPLTYVIHEGGAPNLIVEFGNPPAGTDISSVVDGFDIWASVPDANLTSVFAGTTPDSTSDGLDGINQVTFRDPDFVSLFGNAVIAVGLTTSFTEPTEFGGELKRPGQIVDADMLFNPTRAFSSGFAESGVVIEAVAVHEAGHLFGMNHSALPAATMFPALPSGLDAASLEIDDLMLAYMSYPAPGTIAGATQASGTITDGATGLPIPGAAVFALNAGSDTKVAVQFTLPDGTWTMAGLPSGDYDFFVAPLDGGSDVFGVVPGYINDLVNSTAQTLFVPEFYSASETASDDPELRTTVSLQSGAPVTGVDIVTNADEAPPVVLQVTPTDGTVDAAAKSVVLVKFSEPISFASVATSTSSRFSLVPDGGTASVAGQLVAVGTKDVLVFTPAAPLQFGTTYTLTLDPGIEDPFGNPTPTAFTSQFTVEAKPPLDISTISPQVVVSGSVVVISGQGFETANPGDNVVSFAGIPVPATNATTTSIVAQVPSGIPLGAFQVSVSTASETAPTTLEVTGTDAIATARATAFTSVPLSALPNQVAVLPDGSWALVATDAGLEAVVTDGSSPAFGVATLQTIASGLDGVAAAPGRLRSYAISSDAKSLFVIDTDDGGDPAAPTTTFLSNLAELPTGVTPLGIAVDPTGREAWVPAQGGVVQVWDLVPTSATLFQQIGEIVTGAFELSGDVAFSRDGTRAYVTGDQSLFVIDTTSRQTTATVPLPGTAASVVEDPTGTLVYASDVDGNVNVVPVGSTSVSQSIDADASLRGIAIGPAGRLAYAADRRDEEIAIVDLRSEEPSFRTVIANVGTGEDPIDVEVAPDGQIVISVSEGSQSLDVFLIDFGPTVGSIYPPFVRPGDIVAIGGDGFATSDSTSAGSGQFSEVDFDGEIVGRTQGTANQTGFWFDRGWARVPSTFAGGPIRVLSTFPEARVTLPSTFVSNPGFVSAWTQEDLERSRRLLLSGPSVEQPGNFPNALNLRPLVHPGGDYVLVDDDLQMFVVDIRETSPTFLKVVRTISLTGVDLNDPLGTLGPVRAFTPDGELLYTHNSRVVNYYDARLDSPTFMQRLGAVDMTEVDPNGSIFQFSSLTPDMYIAPDGGQLYVGANVFEDLVVVDLLGPGGNRASDRLSLSSGDTSGRMRFHPNGRWAWVVTSTGAEVVDLDPFSASYRTSVVSFPDINSEAIEDVVLALDGSGVWAVTRAGGLGGEWRLWWGEFVDSPNDVTWARSQDLEVGSTSSAARMELHPNGRRATVVIPERRMVYVDLSPTFDPDAVNFDFPVFEEINTPETLGLFSFTGKWAPDGNRFFAVEQTDTVLRTFDFPAATDVSIAIVSGDDQTGVVGERLPAPVRAVVIGETGDASDLVIEVQVISGGGTLEGGVTERFYVTDEFSRISIEWTLGPDPGENRITVSPPFGTPFVVTANGVVAPESIPLQLVQVLPLPGSTGVKATSSAQVVFSRAVDRTTVTTSSVVLRETATGNPVPAFLGFSDQDRRVSLIPNAPLQYDSTYQVEVADTIADLDGGTLGTASSTTFVVETAPAPTLGGITPVAGTVGSTVVVSGSGFDADLSDNVVTLNGVPVILSEATINSLRFTVPSGAATGPLAVSVNGVPAGSAEFTVLVPNTIPIDDIDDTIELGAATQALAVLPNGLKGYAVSTTTDAVIPVDLLTLTNGDPIPVGTEPVGAVSDVLGTFVYVANRGSNSVSVIDTATDTVVGTIPLDASPREILTSPNGDRIYVVTPTGQAVEVIDSEPGSATYNTVVARFTTGSSTSGASISPDGGVLYLGTDQGFLTIDLGPVNFGVVARFTTGSSTSGASISPDGTLLVLLTTDDEVLLIDISGPGFGTVVARFTTGSSTSGASISPDGTILYLITEDTDEVLAYAINVGSTVSVLEGLPVYEIQLLARIDAGDDPRWIAFDPRDPTVVFVGASGDLAINVFGRVAPNDTPCDPFEVVFGTSWDGVSLQSIFDARYGVGAIDVATEYEGYRCGDAVVPYWLDDSVDGWIVEEVAESARRNVLGWYAENFTPPSIDGVDDGVIFDGVAGPGSTTFVGLTGPTRFGLYLNPNGDLDAINAPEPELFFTNRRYNDEGPDGSGAIHPPTGGDPQALIYDITHLRNGVPTYVVAWEDGDSGSELAPEWAPGKNDNDFNDFVVEVRASSPVSAVVSALQVTPQDDGVRVAWSVSGAVSVDRFVVERRTGNGAFERIATVEGPSTVGEYVDRSPDVAGEYGYRVAALLDGGFVLSQEVRVSFTPAVVRETALLRAVPNPFNPMTTIEYGLAQPGPVELRIYNLAGRLVRTIDLGEQPRGTGQVQWNGIDDTGRGVASGAYLVKLVTPSKTDVLRVMLLK